MKEGSDGGGSLAEAQLAQAKAAEERLCRVHIPPSKRLPS